MTASLLPFRCRRPQERIGNLAFGFRDDVSKGALPGIPSNARGHRIRTSRDRTDNYASDDYYPRQPRGPCAVVRDLDADMPTGCEAPHEPRHHRANTDFRSFGRQGIPRLHRPLAYAPTSADASLLRRPLDCSFWWLPGRASDAPSLIRTFVGRAILQDAFGLILVSSPDEMLQALRRGA